MPENSAICADLASARKRIGYGFMVETTGPDATEVHVPTNTTHACGSDSGAPWLFVRGGELIAFAIQNALAPDFIIFGDYQKPAPGPGCPSAQHCCEPLSATVCGRCVSNNYECP